MVAVSTILFIICPILSLPLLVFGFLNDKKHRYLYCILFSIVLSIISYHFIPSVKEDLFRHHLDIIKLRGMSFDNFKTLIFSSTEQISLLLKYFVSLTNNNNILQFIVTFITYLLVFYIIVDTANRKDLSKVNLFLLTFFTIVSINYITIVSNLFSMMATCLFSLGIYLEYEKKCNKIISYVCYILSVFIHTSLALPILIIILFKLFKEKISLASVISIIIMIVLIPQLIIFLSGFNIPLMNELAGFYKSYFINNSNYSYLHTTSLLIIYFLKIVPFIICYLFMPKIKKEKIDDFSFFVFLLIIVLFFQTTFAIRYIPIIQLCGIPLLAKYLKTSKNSIFIFLIILVLLLPECYYQYIQIKQRDFGDIFDYMFKNIISIFRLGGD